MALRKAVFDRQILSLDVAGFAQSLAERGDEGREPVVGGWAEDADHRHRLLLRAPSERPCRHRAGQKNYEFASPHAPASRSDGEQGLWLKRATSDRLGEGQLSTQLRPCLTPSR